MPLPAAPSLRFTASLAFRIFGLGLLSAGGVKAQGEVGLLSGSVVESELGFVISGATVSIEGVNLKATTDNEGRFRIENVKSGTYTLVVSREGFIAETFRDQVVRGGEVTNLTLPITAKVIEYDTFVVLPEEESGGTTALVIDTPTAIGAVGTTLGAEFISQSGASDAGEALAKVSGASVADSRYVVIRGLSDRYNVVVLNGARVPSSDPDRRAVNIDIFPGNLIENLVVQKTFSPELPGEVTGGYVNVITTGIPKENFVKFSFGIGYNHQATGNDRFVHNKNGIGTGILGTSKERQIPGYLLSVPTDGNVITNLESPADGSKASDLFDRGSTTRDAPPEDFSMSASAGFKGEFFGDPLGIVAALSYSQKYRYDGAQYQQKISRYSGESRLTSQQLIEQGTEELLAGALISVGWQPHERDLVKLTYFGNIAAEDLAQYSIGLGRPLIDAETGIEPGGTIFDILASNQGRFLEREVSRYVERQLHTWQASGTHYPGEDDEINWVAAYSLSFQDEPEIKLTNIAKRLPQGTYSSIDADFIGSPIDRIWRRVDDQNYFIKLDHAMQLFGKKDEGGSARFRYGGSFDQSTRDFRADTFGFSTNRSSRNFVPALLNDPDDRANFTYADQLIDFYDDPSQLGNGDNIRRIASPDIYHATQTVLGGFFSTTIHYTDQLSTGIGMRVEEYSQFVDSEAVLLPNSYPSSVRNILADAPRPFRLSQTDFMPQVSGHWQAHENFGVSSTFARTVARPSFKEIAPTALRVIEEPGQFFVGNTDLEISHIDNYDIRLEWLRPEQGESFAFSGFSKFIDKPIEFVSGIEVDQFKNAETGVVWGWELEASKKLEAIPPLRHMTLSGNFAQIFSAVELEFQGADYLARQNNGLDTNRRLQGQPDYIVNVNATYDNKDDGLFLGLFLNITGQLLAAGGSGEPNAYALDILQQPSASLDFAVSKEITEIWKLGFRAENLLDSAREFRYSDGSLRGISHSGINYSLSLSGSW